MQKLEYDYFSFTFYFQLLSFFYPRSIWAPVFYARSYVSSNIKQMSGAQEPHQLHIMVGKRNMEMGNYILKTSVLMGRLGSWNCSIDPVGNKLVIHSNKSWRKNREIKVM